MSANFLWYNGSSANNGLLTSSALSLLTTELNSLANNSNAVSSVGGSSGAFNQSNTGQGELADLFLTLGAIGTALNSGAFIPGWFLRSYDGGTTFENPNFSLARAFDFVFAFPGATIAASQPPARAGLVMIPAVPFKVQLANFTGQTLASSGNVLRAAIQAQQY